MIARAGSSPLPAGHVAQLLEEMLFERVADLVDLPSLYELEAMLAHQIEHLGVRCDHAREHAKALVDRALVRVAEKPRRWVPAVTTSADAASGDAACCGVCGEPLAAEPGADAPPTAT